MTCNKEVAALIAFFYPIMSPKLTTKTNTKTSDIFAKKGVNKVSPKKPKKPVTSSDDSSDSSEEEPPRKSKKNVVKKEVPKKKSKKPITSSDESSEESSESESDDEIIVEALQKKVSDVVPDNGLAKLGEGLVAIAEQLAVSNAANTKILEVLAEVLSKMEIRDNKRDVDDDIIAVIDDVVRSGKVITIGGTADDVADFHFETFAHLRRESGKFASQSNFKKTISDNEDELLGEPLAPL
jgi:hypothetical protein